MANTTFNGPVRSQNGFQEWNGSAWVPVAGGGGNVSVFLNASATAFGADNRYSDDSSQDPPTGPTAGNIIQLPAIEVGQAYSIIGISGGSQDAWALQLPSISGVDLTVYSGLPFSASYDDGNFPVATVTATYATYSSVFTPVDTLYIYGRMESQPVLQIGRGPNLVVPGFGTLAVFFQLTTPIFRFATPAPDPYVYPYTQLLSP